MKSEKKRKGKKTDRGGRRKKTFTSPLTRALRGSEARFVKFQSWVVSE